MSLKAITLAFCLIFGFAASTNLIADVNNPILVNPPWNAQNGAVITIKFSFPSATPTAIGPAALGSYGLNYKQFIGVAFPTLPTTIAATDLLFDQGSNPKWGCSLTDGTNTYTVTPIQPVASPIVTTLVAESNIAYCRLDDISSNVPLKTGPGTIYTLTLTLTSVKIASTNFVNSISLFTSTSNNPEKQIIDSIPVLGSIALYGDYTSYSPKALDISSASITVTTGPSAAGTASTVYPYNTFDIVLSLKVNSFISAADHIIVFKYPSDVVSAASTVASADNATGDTLQVALTGSLALKTFGTDGVYLDGVTEDLIPNRQFKLTLKNWKALDTNIGNTLPLTMYVYYKNTYSVLSYVTNNIFLVTTATITLTANHPENWDVFESGAWPITFSFKSNTDLTNGGWVLIQHNAVAQTNTAGSKLTFIASTCDFSANDTSFDNSFAKRPNCYPLRTLDDSYPNATGTYNGSGIFFFMKGTITSGKLYYVTVWAFMDICGGSTVASSDVVNSQSTASAVPNFTMTIYQTLNPAVLNESRFTTLPSGITRQNAIGTSTSTAFSGRCWNTLIWESDAASYYDGWTVATTLSSGHHELTASNSPTKVGMINYREIFDWVAFSETNDSVGSITGSPWYSSPAGALSAAATGIKFLYSTNNAIATGSSYFVVAYRVEGSTADVPFWTKTGLPVINDGSGAAAHPPGKWVWQFPSAWFAAGNGYKGTTPAPTCYASWSITGTNATPVVDITGANLLTTVTNSVPQYSGTATNFFAAVTSSGTASIDTTNSLLPPDWTSGSVMRLVSTYNDGAGAVETRWKIADYTKTVGAGNPMNVAFFTSCVKWKSTLPSITSLYTYIDVQIKWNYIPTGGTTTSLGTTISNIRMIKLFPETGVLHDFTKNPTPSTQTVSPMISHTIYTPSTRDSICLIELNGSAIQALKDSASDTLVIWLFFGTLLETDYNDTSATYPAAPLVSGINAYGLQSGQPMDSSNTWVNGIGSTPTFTPIYSQFGRNNSSKSMTTTTNTMQWPNSSSYIWFMGSVLYLSGVTTNLTGTTETSLLIPYYCPRWNSTLYNGTTKAAIFPLAMAAWMTVRAFNNITNLNTWVNYSDTSNTTYYVKLLGSKYTASSSFDVMKNALSAAATLNTATLKWNTYTGTDTNLYVYNGTVGAAGGAAITCSGHSLFLSPLIQIDATVTTSYTAGYTGAIGVYNNKNFYVLGKIFNKGVFYGLGSAAAPSTANMSALIATGSSLAGNYYAGIKRPAVTDFLSGSNLVLTDRVGYACSAVNKDKNEGLTNYVVDTTGSNAVRNFILDWQSNLTGINSAWLTPTIGWDKTDVSKTDVAGNFKIGLSPPVQIPTGTQIRFTANSNAITSNTICGMQLTTGGIAKDCVNDNLTIKCTIPASGTSFNVCCYNIYTSDPISLATVIASFPADTSIAGISSYLTSDIYSAANQIGGSTNPFSFVTSNSAATDIIGTKNASISAIAYSQTIQEGGIGKVTFTVALPREITRDMKLSIIGDLSGMLVPGNIPRCVASFGKDQYGANWDNGDALIDTCSANNISGATPLVVTTKKMTYKCGQVFYKTMYISLWPVVIVNWASTSVNKSFKVTMQLNSGDNIALNTQAFDMTLATPTSAKPAFTGQWDSLCTVSSVTPKIPGELADYQFDFDLDTNKASLTNTNPNEIQIFWPYKYYGAMTHNVLCYYSGMVNCSFTDEGILSIRFTTNLSIGSGKKISITIVNVRNPNIDTDYSFPCTVSNTNWATNTRTNLITGSGKLSGGITTSGITTQGSLKFLQVPTPASDKNPRNTSIHKFRITFDNAVALTASPVTIANTPTIYIYFPTNYKLAWYNNKPSASIDEYTNDATTNKITKTSTISPASVTASGNRITLTLSQTSYTFATTWRYWDITISNIINPADATTSTRAYQVTLTNSSLSSFYKTYTNINNYVGDALTTPIDSNIAYNRGNSFTFDNSKWALDIYQVSSLLNQITIKAGRYTTAYYNVKSNTSTTIAPWLTTMSLNDANFKTDKNYVISTSYNQPVSFLIGCACGTAPGYYIVNFTSSDSTNFTTLSPVLISVDNTSKGTISLQTPPTVPIAGSVWVNIYLSDPNFDTLNITWSAADSSKNDDSAKITNVVIPAGTVTPSSGTAAMSPVYTVFSITSTSATGAQAFKTSDPNSCYSFQGSNTLTFTISGQPAAVTSTMNLTPAFKYYNADTDTTLPAKNSIKFNFTPPTSPIYLYCALACINMAYPADATIQTPTTTNTPYLQFYSNVFSTTTSSDIIFTGLVRGMKYHLRCIAQSTQGDSTARGSATVNLENYSITTGTSNTTTVDIQPSSPQATQCAQWQFLAEPGQTARIGVVNYCQKIFSGPGYWNNGCVICTYSDMSYNAPGLTLPTNITCPTTTKTSLRFLQTSTTTSNTTTYNTTTLTVCPVPHPICATDFTGGKGYADYFNQMINDLKTTALFKTNLNVDNIQLNTTNPTVTVLDTTAPDITKVSVNLANYAATGAVSWTAMYSSPLQCYWQITDATTAPTFSAIQGCTDTSWCGTAKVGPSQTTISTTNLKAFTPGTTYIIYMACTNDIPMAQKYSSVASVGSFNIPTPITPPNNTNTTTGGNFVSFSLMALMILLALLI